MKLSLRNAALASALCLSGAMMAQTPTVELKWSKTFAASEVTYNESRFGTGFGGKVYFNDKANGAIKVTDGTTLSTFATVAGVGTGITTDDAGNVLVNTGFPGSASSTNFVIVSADGTTQKTLELTLPSGITAGRVDQIGRVAGDMLSEEGAIFYLPITNNDKVLMVYVQNGEQSAPADWEFFTSEPAVTFNNSSIAQPLYTVAELIEMGDEDLGSAAANACVWRLRSSFDGKIWDGAEWVNYATRPEGCGQNEGFDAFNLGGVDYQCVLAAPQAGKHGSALIIADAEGNIIYKGENVNSAMGYTNGASITARKADDKTVEVYTWYPMNGGHVASMYTVTLAGETTDTQLYAAGNILGNGWKPEEAVEFTYSNGKYSLDLGHVSNASFKISTVKGPWDPAEGEDASTSFNGGALGVSPDEFTLTLDKAETLVAGMKGNLNIIAPGTYVVVVDLEAMTLTLTGEKDPVKAPEVADVYLRGDNSSWNAQEDWKFEYVTTEGSTNIYSKYLPAGTVLDGQFKVADDSWTTINFGAAAGSTNMVMVGPTVTLALNGQNLQANSLTNVTLVFRHSGDSDVPSTLKVESGEWKPEGVADIEVAEDAAAVYYNLQGVEVDAENLSAGVYVKVAGGKASKVLVK